MLSDVRHGHACEGRVRRTKVVGSHHDAILELDGEYARPCDDGLLCALNAICARILVWSWVERVGPIRVDRIVSL